MNGMAKITSGTNAQSCNKLMWQICIHCTHCLEELIILCSTSNYTHHTENTPPLISADARLRVNLEEEFTYSLTVVDPGDNFTLTVLGELANQAQFEKIDDEQYSLKLNLKTLTNDALVLVANDSKGASTTFIPILEICACVNGGQCTTEGVLTSNTTIIMKCLCDEGNVLVNGRSACTCTFMYVIIM